MSVLATIAQIATIAAAVGAAFSFAVLRPLNASIKALQKAIDEMRVEMKESETAADGGKSAEDSAAGITENA